MDELKELNLKPFSLFNNDWALLTSGPLNNHNSMTISWGEIGTLWSKSVVTVYVKPCRYTYSFMENNDLFVVSFFNNKYKEALGIMGSISGRDVDKDELSGLTPIKHGDTTIYKEAKMTLICKKIYYSDLSLDKIPEKEKNIYYQIEKPHRMYIGEIIEIIKQGK